MRLLIVEDEKQICDMVAKSLYAAGYEVDTCYDGKEALECIPVSYTHLSGVWPHRMCLLISKPLRYGKHRFSASAVSYTHLDVYKRQANTFHQMIERITSFPHTMCVRLVYQRIEPCLLYTSRCV